MIERGGIHWVDLDAPQGSRPGKRRPVLVVQSDAYTASALATVLALVVTSNTSLAALPGNVFLPFSATELPKDSVANVSQVITIDRDFLIELAGRVRGQFLKDVENGLRLVLAL